MKIIANRDNAFRLTAKDHLEGCFYVQYLICPDHSDMLNKTFLSYGTNLKKIYDGFLIKAIFMPWVNGNHPGYILEFILVLGNWSYDF